MSHFALIFLKVHLTLNIKNKLKDFKWKQLPLLMKEMTVGSVCKGFEMSAKKSMWLCSVSYWFSFSASWIFFFFHGSFCIIKKYWEYFDYGCTGIRNSKMSFHYYKFLIQRELYLDLLLSVTNFVSISKNLFFFFFLIWKWYTCLPSLINMLIWSTVNKSFTTFFIES